MRDVPEPANSNNREYQIYALIDPRDKTTRFLCLSVTVVQSGAIR